MLFASVASTAQAQTTIQVGGFNVQYWDPADGDAYAINTTFLANQISLFSQAEIDAMDRAFLYWTDVLQLDPADADSPVMRMINVTSVPSFNANALSVNTGGNHNVIDRLLGGTPARDNGIDGRNVFFPANIGFGTDEITQFSNHATSMEMIAIHELGHTLGVATYDHAPFLAEVFIIGGTHTFTGANAVSVYGGSGIPLAGDGGHTAIPYENITRGLVQGFDFRNVPHASPAELAILADLGFDVVLSDNFGRAYYQDSQSVTDNTNYSPGNRFGIGLYILSDSNNIIQNGDLTVSGDIGTGLRLVGGMGNTVTIGSASDVMVSGTNGIGILASGGASHDIVVRGNVSATGTNGTGIRLDFGNTFIFNNIDSRNYGAALVNDLDISGSVSGETNAIVISNTAGLNRLNIMDGTSISGNIINNALVDAGNGLVRPELTFGYEADGNGQVTGTADNAFSFTYDDDIVGSTLFNATFAGGTTNLNGLTNFNDADVMAGATLGTASGMFNSESLDLMTGATLNVSGGGVVDVTNTINAMSGVNVDNDSTSMIEASTFNLMNGATLTNNGMVMTNSFTIGNNALIGGNGTISANNPITLNGTTAPGNSIGTQTFNADLIFSSTSTEEIEIQAAANPIPGTDNDLIQVNGSVMFNGGTVDVQGLPPGGAYTMGATYTWLQTTGGIGVNTAPILTEDLLNFRVIPFFTSNSAGFMLANDAPYLNSAVNYNERNTAAYLDAVKLNLANPQIQMLRDQLDTLSGTVAVRNALNQLSGEIYGTAAIYQIQSMNHLMDVLMNQVGHNHAPNIPCMNEIWYSGYVSDGRVSNDGNASTTDYDSVGHIVGKSWCVGPETVSGFFYNYENQSVRSTAVRSEVETDAHRLGLYLRDQRGLLHTTFTGFTGWNNHDSTRNVRVNALSEQNTGDYNGWTTGFLYENGLTFGNDTLHAQPFGSLQYLHAETEDFSETGGAVTSLRVDEIHANSLRSKLGGRFKFFNFRKLLSFDVETAWVHEMGETAADYQVGLNNSAGNFNVRGADLGSDWVNFSPSMNWMVGPFRSYLEYQAAFGEASIHSGQWGTELIW
jgi:uncharacterized protein with beta-barrel porin domain